MTLLVSSIDLSKTPNAAETESSILRHTYAKLLDPMRKSILAKTGVPEALSGIIAAVHAILLRVCTSGNCSAVHSIKKN